MKMMLSMPRTTSSSVSVTSAIQTCGSVNSMVSPFEVRILHGTCVRITLMPKRYRIAPGSKVRLRDFDPDDTSLVDGGKKEGEAMLEKMGDRLDELQDRLYVGHQHKLLIVLQ